MGKLNIQLKKKTTSATNENTLEFSNVTEKWYNNKNINLKIANIEKTTEQNKKKKINILNMLNYFQL